MCVGVINNAADAGIGVLSELDESAVESAVGGNLVGGQPGAVDVVEKVVGGANGEVLPLQSKAGAAAAGSIASVAGGVVGCAIGNVHVARVIK